MSEPTKIKILYYCCTCIYLKPDKEFEEFYKCPFCPFYATTDIFCYDCYNYIDKKNLKIFKKYDLAIAINSKDELIGCRLNKDNSLEVGGDELPIWFFIVSPTEDLLNDVNEKFDRLIDYKITDFPGV